MLNAILIGKRLTHSVLILCKSIIYYSFKSGFKNQLEGADCLFMQSDGGLTKMESFRGARAILSGPAGGVVGYAVTGSRETKLPLIGFDMGGTSINVIHRLLQLY